jgi:hypothetical protein
MGNNNNSGGSTMMILLVVCVCCCCVSSLIPVVAYFAYPPFKTWLNGLFGLNPIGGTWTCRQNYYGFDPAHPKYSQNPNGPVVKASGPASTTDGKLKTDWGGQDDASWACNNWISGCGKSPGLCTAYAA